MPLCRVGFSSDSEDGIGRVFSSASNARNGRPATRKVVVVGDGASGKTSMLNVFVSGSFPETHEPTVFENHVVSMVVDGTPLELALWDTAGQEDFQKLRALSYTDTHVILLCFSVDNPTSLENVESKWIDEIHEMCPGVKIALVALKCDLRDDPQTKAKLARQGEGTCQYEHGLAVARRIRASRYLECSAKHDRGVQEAFDEAGRCALVSPRRGDVGRRPSGSGGPPDTGCTIS